MKVIFINCFGGVTNITKVLAVLRMAIETDVVTKPVVVRLRGNGEEGLEQMIFDCTACHEVHLENDFTKACELAVNIANREEALSKA